MDNERPDPDLLLKMMKEDEARTQTGRLRVFLGMCPGVGKTFSMLRAAQAKLADGCDVVVGIVETHGRFDTIAMAKSLPLIERRKTDYKGVVLEEMDIDAILKRKPALVLVDELAHTNVPGSRHAKRYQDVIELLDAGIDVFTTINVQHLESRKDLVEKVTGVSIRETVPDTLLERADQIEVIDITPEELLKRLKEGRVYLGERADRAAENFFKQDSLTALREIALRFTAEKVDHELQRFHDGKTNNKPWRSSERLMVAVGHSPYSPFLIRATRRLAYSLEAPWIAVYVDTGLKLNLTDQNQLAKNVALARELRAEVVTTTDTDIPQALKRIARQKNVTQIVVGRPAKRWIRDFIEGGSLLERLVKDSQDIDVHVIRQEKVSAEGSIARRTLRFESSLIAYWNSLWFFIGIGFLSGFVEPYIGYRAVGFLFLLGVLTVGRVGRMGPVMFSALISAVGWNFFFIPPRLTFAISTPEDFIMCLTYFVVAMITGTLTSRVRRHEILLRDREDRTNVLYEVLKDISTSSAKSEFLERVAIRIGQVLDGDAGVVLKARDGRINERIEASYRVQLDAKELAVAQWSFANRKAAGWSTDTLADSKYLFVPLDGNSEILGVFAFKPRLPQKLSVEQESLLRSVCRQLGLSLERHFAEKRLIEAEKLKESEKLHQTLLNSISHEMRTPLTVILGSASALGDDTVKKTDDLRKSLANEITAAGERLNRVIENLLDMSRLSSGVLAIKKEWHDVHDLIRAALSRVGRHQDRNRIRIDVPQDLPLVEMDFRLLQHAVSNVIFNAITYVPGESEICLTASISNGQLSIIVDDSGPGIPEESIPVLFDKFYRVPGSPTGGTGLGLSIVKSIVEFHSGTVTVTNRQEGGARFQILLPVGDLPAIPKEIDDEDINRRR